MRRIPQERVRSKTEDKEQKHFSPRSEVKQRKKNRVMWRVCWKWGEGQSEGMKGNALQTQCNEITGIDFTTETPKSLPGQGFHSFIHVLFCIFFFKPLTSISTITIWCMDVNSKSHLFSGGSLIWNRKGATISSQFNNGIWRMSPDVWRQESDQEAALRWQGWP